MIEKIFVSSKEARTGESMVDPLIFKPVPQEVQSESQSQPKPEEVKTTAPESNKPRTRIQQRLLNVQKSKHEDTKKCLPVKVKKTISKTVKLKKTFKQAASKAEASPQKPEERPAEEKTDPSQEYYQFS